MNMRKSFYQFLFMAAFMLLPLTASAVEIGGINYVFNVSNKTAEVTNKAYQGSVVIPDDVTYNWVKFRVTGIAGKAFEGCTGLTSVTIGNNVTYIGNRAFYGCSGLTSVTIGNNVTTIGGNAFQDCRSLVSIDIPDNVTTIKMGAFCGCTSLTSIVIPNSMRYIEQSVFASCSSLASVVIGNSVKDIGSDAFQYCEALTSITIPNNVRSIGDGAFHDCSNLTSVVMGNGIEYIESMVFANCKALTEVFCYAKEMPLMVNGLKFVTDAFQGSPIEQASLYVPVSKIEQYKSLEPWKNFGNIIPVDDAVGVVSAHKDCSDTTIKYDLQGRRLMQKPTKGVYIQDGKKVVVK